MASPPPPPTCKPPRLIGLGLEGLAEAFGESLVIRVDFGRSSFLIMGDLEQEAHPALIKAVAGKPELLRADVFAPAHHGSHNGTTADLVEAVFPKIAVISAGNPTLDWHGLTARDFAHPNQATIKLL